MSNKWRPCSTSGCSSHIEKMQLSRSRAATHKKKNNNYCGITAFAFALFPFPFPFPLRESLTILVSNCVFNKLSPFILQQIERTNTFERSRSYILFIIYKIFLLAVRIVIKSVTHRPTDLNNTLIRSPFILFISLPSHSLFP